MVEVIIGTPLSKPPREADRLASNGNLLVVWQWTGYVVDEDGAEYHFAIHSPAWGWHGYRWQHEYGPPLQILPATEDTMWVHVGPYRLMYLNIGRNGKVAITNTGVEVLKIFHADAQGVLVKVKDSKINLLRFTEDDRQLCKTDLYYAIYPSWVHFLSDEAIAIHDSGRLIVVSPEGARRMKRRVPVTIITPPFIICPDEDCIYYTNDPRKGWCRSKGWGRFRAIEPHRECTSADTSVCLFTIHGDVCYVALKNFLNDQYNAHLYYFSTKSPKRIERIWGITTGWYEPMLTHHNGLVCIIHPESIAGCDYTRVPENDGFLAWNPITNAFYTDISRATNIQKMAAGRSPTINIPGTWGMNKQR